MISKYAAVLAAHPGLAARSRRCSPSTGSTCPRCGRGWWSRPAPARRRPRRRPPARARRAAGAVQPGGRGQLPAHARTRPGRLPGPPLAAGVPPSLAQLLASIRACEAAHAALLDRRGATVTAAGRRARPGTAGNAALQDALAAENAAIFGYGVAGAYLTGRQRAPRRRTGTSTGRPGIRWPACCARAASSPPPPPPSTSCRSACTPRPRRSRWRSSWRTASRPPTWAWSGPATLGLRTFGARAMQASAIRATSWRGSSVAFPGLPAATAKSPPADPVRRYREGWPILICRTGAGARSSRQSAGRQRLCVQHRQPRHRARQRHVQTLRAAAARGRDPGRFHHDHLVELQALGQGDGDDVA